MKKVIAVISMVAAITILSGCSVRLYEDEKNMSYYNTIYRGRETHNFIVIHNQNEKILENQEKILANQEEILKLLEARQ